MDELPGSIKDQDSNTQPPQTHKVKQGRKLPQVYATQSLVSQDKLSEIYNQDKIKSNDLSTLRRNNWANGPILKPIQDDSIIHAKKKSGRKASLPARFLQSNPHDPPQSKITNEIKAQDKQDQDNKDNPNSKNTQSDPHKPHQVDEGTKDNKNTQSRVHPVSSNSLRSNPNPVSKSQAINTSINPYGTNAGLQPNPTVVKASNPQLSLQNAPKSRTSSMPALSRGRKESVRAVLGSRIRKMSVTVLAANMLSSIAQMGKSRAIDDIMTRRVRNGQERDLDMMNDTPEYLPSLILTPDKR